jgi:hypothetical protein
MTLPNTVRELNAQFGLTLDPEGVTAAQRAEYERLLHTVQPITEVNLTSRGNDSGSSASRTNAGSPDDEKTTK